jgi:uncharacterized protein (TIGR02996 family)
MTPDDVFVTSIIETPADDALRLIYADWIEEHGDTDRAALVRVQVELARLPEDAPARATLERQEDALLAEHAERWLAPLRDLLPDADCTPLFHRGFVSEVTFWGQAGARQLAENAEELFRCCPVEVVRLLPVGGHAPKLFPWDRPKVEVDRLGLDDLRAVQALPQLSRVRLLDLSGTLLESPEDDLQLLVANYIGDVGARLLADCPNLRDLQALLLRDNAIRDDGARALVASPHLRGLTTLDLSHNFLSVALKDELEGSTGGRVTV